MFCAGVLAGQDRPHRALWAGDQDASEDRCSVPVGLCGSRDFHRKPRIRMLSSDSNAFSRYRQGGCRWNRSCVRRTVLRDHSPRRASTARANNNIAGRRRPCGLPTYPAGVPPTDRVRAGRPPCTPRRCQRRLHRHGRDHPGQRCAWRGDNLKLRGGASGRRDRRESESRSSGSYRPAARDWCRSCCRSWDLRAGVRDVDARASLFAVPLTPAGVASRTELPLGALSSSARHSLDGPTSGVHCSPPRPRVPGHREGAQR